MIAFFSFRSQENWKIIYSSQSFIVEKKKLTLFEKKMIRNVKIIDGKKF